MKKPLLFFSFIIFFALSSIAQITTPAVNAYFGVDADLKARYTGSNTQSADDWYLSSPTTGNQTDGAFVIDTAGAASILAGYNTDVSPYPKRMASFFRNMSVPSFTIVNNRLWLDALFVRDFHGNDMTAFTAGSDKNGMSPENWSGGTQGVPDKNDILDMFMHVRRSGPAATDPLWLFGGLSLENVTGNRYFDFEMYQTDIYFDRASAKWYGYGPDAGHTSWQFDAAGNVTRPGDIIFSAEYQSSSLTNIEARIWIDKASLNLSPTQFNWSGQFNGASSGAQYGYASILPKTAGDFYTGLQSANGEWTGPFSLVRQDNSLATTYNSKQFMEFSVNLTKLGLDPVSIFGSDICGTPFNRMVVKTRASASFTAELKDFVAPIDLFLAPRADALANVPLFCGNNNNASTLQVTNPAPSSIYTWSTIDGHILGNPASSSVTADRAGTYVVTQQLMTGCSTYSQDTVKIVYDPYCSVLEEDKINLSVNLKNGIPLLSWISNSNNKINSYEIQRSDNGKDFKTIEHVNNANSEASLMSYTYADETASGKGLVYYRLKIIAPGKGSYTQIVKLELASKSAFTLFPNPASNTVRLRISDATNAEEAKLAIYNLAGNLMYEQKHQLKKGDNTLLLTDVKRLPDGIYLVSLKSSSYNNWTKLIIKK